MTKIYTLTAAVLMALLPTLAKADDVNITASFIKNPSFELDFTSWTNSGMQTQTNSDFKDKDGNKLKAGNKYAEKWTSKGNKIGTTSVVQTISILPDGHYRLTATGQNIQQGSDAAQTGAVIFAGTKTTTVTAAGNYEVVFDGTGAKIQIGFRCTNATGNWVATDNFQLFFIGADAATLASNIEAAEALLAQPMVASVKATMQEAVDAAKALGDGATQAQIDAAALAIIQSFSAVEESVEAMAALDKALTAANKLTDQTMAADVKAALLAAISEAEAVIAGTSTADVEKTTTTLNEAAAAARNSHSAYVKLETAINTANTVYNESKEGAAELKSAIDAAQAVLDSETSKDEDYATATTVLNDAVLAFRVANGTGTAPKVTTGKIIQGSTMIFARGTFPTSGTKEKGFCYSTTNPEPTIYDGRSTDKWAHYEGSTSRGDIYYMEDLQPATCYYIRAYAIGNGYKVGYGDVIKTYTLPKAGASWSYDDAGDAETNARIRDAVQYAIDIINATTQFKNFHLNVHYVPGAGAGGGTADCSYGGYMRISQSTSYQRTGTVLHEGGHGMGVGTTNEWYNNSNYRENTSRGNWLGTRVDRVMDFLANSSGNHLTGDNTHMWPYGINGAHEDTGAPSLYHANAMIHEALGEDGLIIAGSNGIQPAYTFECDEETKYYIKNVDEKRGITTAYLREMTSARPKWMEMTCQEALENDSCAWYVSFNPATATYVIKNAATGHALSTSSFTTPKAFNANTSRMQLLPARAVTKNSGHTFASLSYWITNSGKAFQANANGVTAGVDFNHANNATSQRWLFLDPEEAVIFAKATGDDNASAIRQLSTTAEPQLDILGGKGCISISANGQRTAQSIGIYTIDGRLVERVTVQNGATADINLPRGLYIVGHKKVTVR